ncbi:MAG TPA: cobalamin-dependent protein [Anaerolineales bacterium]|nr:cobalamin-dependent protein [Anaerolineales bacterium]
METTGDHYQEQTDLGADLLKWVEHEHIGQLRTYNRGRMLFWQGDPVEFVYMVKNGAVKVNSISQDGKSYAYGVIGAGGIVGVTSLLQCIAYEFMAEAIEDTQVIAIAAAEFNQLLLTERQFSLLVIKKLAQGLSLLASKARDSGLLDAQQRLKHRLVELAKDHGSATEKGVKINLDLTHEEIATLVSANRSTITGLLNELKEQGFLWKEGRHLVIIPPVHIEILDELTRSVVNGEEEEAKKWANKAVESGVDPVKALNALTSGMNLNDRMFNRDEIDVSDVILSAYAMKSAIPIVEAEIEKGRQKVHSIGRVVIGTVSGDIHDIGRTLVAMLLRARGFEVIDLGINVSCDDFTQATLKFKPDILAMSSLMTTSAQEQFKVIRALREAGLREEVKVIVGGGAITEKLKQEMGADGYEPTAHRAVELAWRLTHSA